MADKSHIGMTWRLPPTEVEAGRIRFFAKSIGETDPVHFDVLEATRHGYQGLLAPPTFPLVLELENLDSVDMLQALKVDISKVLHGQQKFVYVQPICSGDVITAVVEIVDVYDKKDGALTMIDVKTTFDDQDSQRVAEMLRTIVVRN